MSCSTPCAGTSAPKWPLRVIDDSLKAAAAGGCSTSVLASLASTAGGLVHAAGFAAPKLQALTPVDVARVSDGMQRGLLLAALQVRDALTLSPQGRQALAYFCGQPVEQHAEVDVTGVLAPQQVRQALETISQPSRAGCSPLQSRCESVPQPAGPISAPTQ